ncbi:MAG: 3-methyladenine glycosylase/8-oxoguanine glycosylase [Burkholderiales bacterium]|jgi:AraC family transcriptional regulator of adaptative response / DNA-3-methyladenine glycosylase II|nr:3-methyladenine glycosylase/8-oxoguanine glycosylase [Burkholderiales bacterium]
MKYNPKEFYRAHLAKDPRFDGKFFVAVKTTKIYCRPICPARKAKLENLQFYIHAVEAEAAGYRPCLRCRPETVPGSAAWVGTSATVRRALRIMESFALTELSINDLAFKLGIGRRWLCELFVEQLGANPRTILLSKKLNIAKNLLESSTLSISDIAFSSGFQSIRRFNDAFKTRFQKTPSEFKCKPFSDGSLKIQLNYRPPFDWDNLLNFFSNRALIKVELIENGSYQRLIQYGETSGWFKAKLCDGNKIEIEFKLNKNANIIEFVTRLKNIFDLDCDSMSIEATLCEDEKLKPFLKLYSGLRIPGCWDGFELAVRTIIGQKISVKGARTILNRLVATYGKKQSFDNSLSLTHFFPTPKDILEADLAKIGITLSKIASIKCLAQAVVNKSIVLDGTADFADTCRELLAIKGIGPWTVEYIAMRALRNPDSFPETDLELQKKSIHLGLNSEKWKPWRAYAAILLWNIHL